MPADVASYLSDLDTKRVVAEELRASERFELATLVRDIRGDRQMKVRRVESGGRSLSLYFFTSWPRLLRNAQNKK